MSTIFTHPNSTLGVHDILSAIHSDVLVDSVVRGDLLIGNSTPKWSRLAFPSSPTGKLLQATATDVGWSANPLTIGASASVSGSNTGDQTLSGLGGLPLTGGTLTGGLTIQPATNTLTALVVNDNASENVLTVDTINKRVGIGMTLPTYALTVSPTGGTALQTALFLDKTPTTGKTQVVIQAGAANSDGGSSEDVLVIKDINGTQTAGIRRDGNIKGYLLSTIDDITAAITQVSDAYDRPGLDLQASSMVVWNGGEHWWTYGGFDIGLSRGGVGKIYVGNGTAGDYTGTLIAGNVGIGTVSPAAVLHLKAGTATANTAPLKLTSGTLLGTPEAGAIEYDGTHFYGTDSGGTRHQLD